MIHVGMRGDNSMFNRWKNEKVSERETLIVLEFDVRQLAIVMDDLCLHINLIVNYKIALGADDFWCSIVVGVISEKWVENIIFLMVHPALQ